VNVGYIEVGRDRIEERVGGQRWQSLTAIYVHDYPLITPAFAMNLVFKDEYDATEYPDSAS